MKISCEHCGAVIDTDKDKKCTICGAPYSTNKEYKDVRDNRKKSTDYDFREREANIRTKELGNQIIEKTLNAQKGIKSFQTIFIIIFIMAIVFIIFIASKMFN